MFPIGFESRLMNLFSTLNSFVLCCFVFSRSFLTTDDLVSVQDKNE